MNFEKTFDNATVDYDRSRPAYPRSLYDDIFIYKPITAESCVLEIGLGTGKATSPILDTGCRYIGIEPDIHLTSLAKLNLQSYDNFRFKNETLQEYEETEHFDLVFAATTFHWIPEEYGYARVFSLLKSGGVFARFAYHAGYDKERIELTKKIQDLYKQFMPSEKEYKEFSEDDARKLCTTAEKYGFVNTLFKLYNVKKNFDADQYMALLRTYPDHMKLDNERRKLLFDGIHSAINENGGTITVNYTMDLELAMKP